jgi:CBS domain-containing protein
MEKSMRAKDVMSTGVITVMDTATVFDTAELLVNGHLSAMPVVNNLGEIVGIVSEADLIRRIELGTVPHKSWLLRLFSDDLIKAAEFIHSHSRRVSDVMTKHVITVEVDATLSEIAALMAAHNIKRVPVIQRGFVVGVVSRTNILQALLSSEPPIKAPYVSNAQLRREVVQAVEKQPWSSTWPTNVFVNDGAVHLWGFVQNETVLKACRVAAENVAGVRSVKNHMRIVPESVSMGV